MEKPKGGNKDGGKWFVRVFGREQSNPLVEKGEHWSSSVAKWPLEFYFDNYWDAYAYCTKLNVERRNKGAS